MKLVMFILTDEIRCVNCKEWYLAESGEILQWQNREKSSDKVQIAQPRPYVLLNNNTHHINIVQKKKIQSSMHTDAYVEISKSTIFPPRRSISKWKWFGPITYGPNDTILTCATVDFFATIEELSEATGFTLDELSSWDKVPNTKTIFPIGE